MPKCKFCGNTVQWGEEDGQRIPLDMHVPVYSIEGYTNSGLKIKRMLIGDAMANHLNVCKRDLLKPS